MTGRKTFAFTKALVNGLFFITLITTVIVVCYTTFRMFGSGGIEGLPDVASASFSVQLGSAAPKVSDYQYAGNKNVALVQLPNQYKVHAAFRSPLGYYAYFMNLLLMAGLACGAWLLWRIFNTMSVEHPFQRRNAGRIRWLGLLIIAVDLLKWGGYYVYTSLASQYPLLAGTQLRLNIGSGLLAGCIVLAVGVVYRRGVEMYEGDRHVM